eukprot:GHVU01048000.1.p1 GENE.GHVU01048000.1~~GHVU01048000.1.p1  ORF type:complete len:379 (-),score=79.72 GHVU01048000.1:139-1275(-)
MRPCVLSARKPSNIMVVISGGAATLSTKRGTDSVPTCTFCLADFGTAQILSDTPAGPSNFGFTGTIEYTAPELLAPDSEGRYRDYETSSDMWALGMILFALCFGRLPYRHRDPRKCRELIIEHTQLRFRGSDSATNEAATTTYHHNPMEGVPLLLPVASGGGGTPVVEGRSLDAVHHSSSDAPSSQTQTRTRLLGSPTSSPASSPAATKGGAKRRRSAAAGPELEFFQQLILALTSKNPEDRPTVDQILRHPKVVEVAGNAAELRRAREEMARLVGASQAECECSCGLHQGGVVEGMAEEQMCECGNCGCGGGGDRRAVAAAAAVYGRGGFRRTGSAHGFGLINEGMGTRLTAVDEGEQPQQQQKEEEGNGTTIQLRM